MPPPQHPVNSMAPIILAPQVQADTLLCVFNQEFHVHSTILKIHGNFFAKFMDSCDKAAGTSTNPRFKYEWISEVDGDGKDWSLVCAMANSEESRSQAETTRAYDLDESKEIMAFSMLLDSMYSKPFTFRSTDEFSRVVRLADYYSALPIFKNGFNLSLPRNTQFITQICAHPDRIVVDAYKMKHAALFRECMIQLMGPLGAPRLNNIQDDILRAIADKFRVKLKKFVRQVEENIRKFVSAKLLDLERQPDTSLLERFTKTGIPVLPGDKNFSLVGMRLPEYYRMLHSQAEWHPEIKRLIKPLLKNNLRLGRDAKAFAGEGWYANYFLCLEITNEELPWEVEQ